MEKKNIRVLIVDDSGVMRQALAEVLAQDPEIQVVGVAKDGREGVAKVRELRPDVITMDLSMPGMTGFETIERIMEDDPTPIIAVSSVEIPVILKALSIGAMDFVPISQEIGGIAKTLIDKIKVASRVRPLRRMKIHSVLKPVPVVDSLATRVVAIGVSTGGPQALQVLFSRIPVDCKAGILIVQHMSAGFMPGLIEWLKPVSSFQVRVARPGDILKNGMILFAPDNVNMTIDSDYRIILRADVSKKLVHVPSIDVMMKSVAESFRDRSVGVLMTGMGRDGAEGMQAIKRSGGTTIAQDKDSSVIFGMNQVAIDSGCVDRIVPLNMIGEEIYRTCQE